MAQGDDVINPVVTATKEFGRCYVVYSSRIECKRSVALVMIGARCEPQLDRFMNIERALYTETRK